MENKELEEKAKAEKEEKVKLKWTEESKKPPIIHAGENNLFRIVTDTANKMHTLTYVMNFLGGQTKEDFLFQDSDIERCKKFAADQHKIGAYKVD